jgi:predicted PurR-regulated permease PerM
MMRVEARNWAVRGAGLAIGAGLVLVFALLVARGWEVILLVFLAILLGAALEPVTAWMRARFGIGRGAAILIVYALFIIVVIGVAVFIVPAAVVQISGALGRLPAFLENIRASTAGLRPKGLVEGIGALIDAAEAPLKPGPPPDPSTVVNASIGVATVAAALVTLLALVYFWLTERSRLQRYVLAFVPLHRRAGVRDAWNEVESRLGLWVRGQLTIMASIGVATGVAYTVIGLPAALLLAVIAAIAEIIPIIGPFIGAVPAVLMATTISPQAVVLTLVVYVAIQFIEGNVLVPMIMRNTVGLSPFIVLLSLLLGGAVGGIAGAIVAVPLVAGAEVILERLQDREVPVPIDPTADRGIAESEPNELTTLAPDAPGGAKRQAS